MIFTETTRQRELERGTNSTHSLIKSWGQKSGTFFNPTSQKKSSKIKQDFLSEAFLLEYMMLWSWVILSFEMDWLNYLSCQLNPFSFCNWVLNRLQKNNAKFTRLSTQPAPPLLQNNTFLIFNQLFSIQLILFYRENWFIWYLFVPRWNLSSPFRGIDVIYYVDVITLDT